MVGHTLKILQQINARKEMFRKETSAMAFFFRKAIQACKVTKKILYCRCFAKDVEKCFRIAFLLNTNGRLLMVTGALITKKYQIKSLLMTFKIAEFPFVCVCWRLQLLYLLLENKGWL